METIVRKQDNFKVLHKIREELVNTLKHQGLRAGIHYHLSSVTEDDLAFSMTVNGPTKNSMGATISEVNKILSTEFKDNIIVRLGSAKTLKIIINEKYFEKMSAEKTDVLASSDEASNVGDNFSIFLDDLKRFIKEKAMPEHKNGFSYEAKDNKYVKIDCTDFIIFQKISKALRANPFYVERLNPNITDAAGKIIKIYMDAYDRKIITQKAPDDYLEIKNKDEIPVGQSNDQNQPEEKPITHEHGLVATEKKDLDSKSYVHSSRNYADFHILKFNRKRKKKHVNKIVESIKKFGVLSFVTVVYTDCIDGTMRMYIVDGQHRFDAFVILGLPILYVIAKANTKEELVRLIAELNRTSKNWTLRDYLTAWSSLSEQYRTIGRCLNKTKLSFTLLLEIYSGQGRGAATRQFQDGKFQIKDLENSEKYIKWILDIRNLKLLPKSREILSSLVVVMNRTKEYDNNKMKDALEKMPVNYFVPGEKAEEITTKLKKLYFAAA